jgi:recyclin-1
MNWNPITPGKTSRQAGSSSKFPTARFASVLKPSKPTQRQALQGPFVGKWPEAVLLRIFQYLPIPDLPNVAKCSRSFSRLVRDDRGWQRRCALLHLEDNKKVNLPKSPVRTSLDDDFGDFSAQKDVFEDVDFEDQTISNRTESTLLDFGQMPLPSRPSARTGFFAFTASACPYHAIYKGHHESMMPLCRQIRSSTSPTSTLSLLFSPSTSLTSQSNTLLLLLLFLSPQIQPLHDWGFLRQALLAACDRFDSTCLGAFEVADGNNDEAGMRAAADSSWRVWEAGGGGRDQWECGRVWVERREVFYQSGKWDPLENIM